MILTTQQARESVERGEVILAVFVSRDGWNEPWAFVDTLKEVDVYASDPSMRFETAEDAHV